VKRGLITLNRAEVSDEEWAERVRSVQLWQRELGLDLALVYGDVSRSDDIGYLSNLCIYWNEAILAVPVTGPPVLLTKLSPRVFPWMRRTSLLTDMRSGPDLGKLIGALVGELGSQSIGLVNAALWTDDAQAVVAAALAERRLVPLGDVVGESRLVTSRAERGLLERAGGIASAAFDKAQGEGSDGAAQVSSIELELRRAGFADALFSLSSAFGATFVEVCAQFRQGWVQVARPTDPGAMPIHVSDTWAGVLTSVRPGTTGADLTAQVSGLGALEPGSTWTVRLVHQHDLSTRGELLDQERPVLAGSVVAVSLEGLVPGDRCSLAETLLVEESGARVLTATAASDHDTQGGLRA
jgi:hypothetical protein